MMSKLALRKVYQDCLEILSCRKNPQDLTVNGNIFLTMLLVYFIISYLSALVFLKADIAMPFALLDVVLLVGFVFVCLSICGFTYRWRQTVSALAGVASIVGVIAMPFSAMVRFFDNVPLLSVLATTALIGLLIWNIIINGHIFRHAFSVLFIAGIAIAVLHYLLINALIVVLIPEYFTP